jgi:hypothetical protein
MATFDAAGAYTTAELAVYVPAIWGEKINEFFKSKLVMADFFTNRSSELADGGNIIYTPNTAEMAASAKSAATQVTLVSPTETKMTLTVDQWYECSFMIEDKEAAQFKKSYYIQERIAKNAGFSVAKKLEVALASLFAGFNTTVGDSATALVDSTIRSAIATLASANVDLQECAFFFDTTVAWSQLMGIDKFTLAINSPTMNPVAKGLMGQLYGIPVYASTNIQYEGATNGRVNALAHSDSLHWATSPLGANSQGGMVGANGVRVQSNYVPEFLSTLVTADILYGVIENRGTAGVAIKTLK